MPAQLTEIRRPNLRPADANVHPVLFPPQGRYFCCEMAAPVPHRQRRKKNFNTQEMSALITAMETYDQGRHQGGTGSTPVRGPDGNPPFFSALIHFKGVLSS